jgi:hypothetical protein
MPKDKDRKRLVRARMRKTGESYTAARSALLRRAARPAPPRVPAAQLAALAGVTDETLRARTGCTWSAWVRALDARGAAELPHRDIARMVHETWALPGWWAQTITVGYERIRGLRDVGQRRGGAYQASRSRTFRVPLARLYAAFATPRRRAEWLPGVDLKVRRATPRRSMRITWPDGSSVEVHFTDKGERSQAAIQHRKLADRAAVAAAKAWWGARLDALGALLAS